MAEFSFEIEEKLLVLSENDKGWTKELNRVSFNGAPAKYDIRAWSPDHTKMGKGSQGHVPAHAVTAIKEKMLHLIMTPL